MDEPDLAALTAGERARYDQDEAEAISGARSTAKVIAVFRRGLTDGGIDTYLADELTREYALTALERAGRPCDGDERED
jgi:hypothetical protein